MNFKRFCFLLIFPFFMSPIYSLSYEFSDSLSFDVVLDMFNDCLIHLYDYQGLNFEFIHTPVVFSRIQSLLNYTDDGKCSDWDQKCVKGLLSFRSRCVAKFHLCPRANVREISLGLDSDAVGYGGYYSEMDELRGTYRRGQGRYQILIQEQGNPSQVELWASTLYMKTLLQGVPSAGFVLTKGNSGADIITHVRNELKIINQFKLFQITSNWVQLGYPVQLSSTQISHSSRHQLDMEMQMVNDYKANEDIPWSLKSVNNPMSRHRWSQYERRKRDTETDSYFGSTTLSQFIRQEMNYTEGSTLTLSMAPALKKDLENYVLASLVIGENASLPNLLDSAGPSIMFDFPGSPHMSDGEREYFEFITCSTKFQAIIQYTEEQVFKELFGIFDLRVWFYIVVCYFGGGLLFGLVYHGTRLKRKMHTTSPLTLGPFVMGLTGLVNQCVDRRINSKRFGFMVCIIIPWILMGVVISHAFRGTNVDVLRRSSARLMYKWPSFSGLRRENIEAITDESMLMISDFRMVGSIEGAASVSQFGEITNIPTDVIANYITMNRDVAFASWSKSVSAVEDRIGYDCRPRRGGGYINSKEWGLRSYMSTSKGPDGWLISKWVDDRIPRRMVGLVESGIADEWRRMMRPFNVRRSWYYGNTVPVRAISMTSNISKVFCLGLVLAIIYFGVWILEHVVYRLLKVLCGENRKGGRGKPAHKMVIPDAESGRQEEVIPPVVNDLLEEGAPSQSSFADDGAAPIIPGYLSDEVDPSVNHDNLVGGMTPLETVNFSEDVEPPLPVAPTVLQVGVVSGAPEDVKAAPTNLQKVEGDAPEEEDAPPLVQSTDNPVDDREAPAPITSDDLKDEVMETPAVKS